MRTFFHFCIKIGAKEYTVPAVFSLAKLHDVTCIVIRPIPRLHSCVPEVTCLRSDPKGSRNTKMAGKYEKNY